MSVLRLFGRSTFVLLDFCFHLRYNTKKGKGRGVSVIWAAVLTTCRGGQCPDAALVDQTIDCLGELGLSAEAQSTLRAIRNLAARTQSVAARLALMWALIGEGGIHPFDTPLPTDAKSEKPLCGLVYDNHGAPCLLASGIAISLAHCDGIAVAACTDEGRIGVDVEPCDRRLSRPAEMVRRYFSPSERRIWEESGCDAQQLLRIWTRKEALGKAKGLGLAHIKELDTMTPEEPSYTELPLSGVIATVCQLK